MNPSHERDIQLQVVGPKVVTPLRDAVRFVNGEQADAHALLAGILERVPATVDEVMRRDDPIESFAPALWSIEQYQDCLTSLGFDIRVVADVTGVYSSMIVAGVLLVLVVIPPTRPVEVMLFLWTLVFPIGVGLGLYAWVCLEPRIDANPVREMSRAAEPEAAPEEETPLEAEAEAEAEEAVPKRAPPVSRRAARG